MKILIITEKQFRTVTYILSVCGIDTIVEFEGKDEEGRRIFNCPSSFEERIINLKIKPSEEFLVLYKSKDKEDGHLLRSIVTIPLRDVFFEFDDIDTSEEIS